MIQATAPGRVNLIGDHTDYTGGLVLPMAIDRATTVEGEPIDAPVVRLHSDQQPEACEVPLDVDELRAVEPAWARYIAGVVSELHRGGGVVHGFEGTVHSTVPVGSGLSSSAALELAVALALGFEGSPLALAQLCRRAEHAATNVPCGIMDQLASAAGQEGHALLIDCSTLDVTPVSLPDDVDIVVIHSGQERALSASAYAQRVRECAAAEAIIGPLANASMEALGAIDDGVVRARATHVVNENERVRRFASALGAGDVESAGIAMVQSHRSLAELYEVSTPVLDAMVARLVATPGVLGARLTGAGFGGCVVALTRPGALREGWVMHAAAGASVTGR
jgi:galactokinase